MTKSASKKFKLLIDADAAAESNKSGIGYYAWGLIESLAEQAPQNTVIIAHYFNFLGRNKTPMPSAPNLTYKVSRLVPRQIVNLFRRWGLSIPYELLTRSRADFIVFPNFLSRRTLFKTPYSVTVHDFTYADYPQYVSKKNQRDLAKLVPVSLRRAEFAVAISRTMQKRLQTLYPWFDKPIYVELLPVKKPLILSDEDCQAVLKKLGIEGNYLLFLGNLEPRKNVVGIINAYLKLDEGLKNKYGLVLAGGEGWNDAAIQQALAKAEKQNASITKLGYVSEKERAALYQSTSLFLFPSFYEGYGLPVLEAMSYHVPVIASNIPVLEEIASQAVVYCDPNNPTDIAHAVKKIITDASLRSSLLNKGNQIVGSRSWQAVAKLFYDHVKRS